MSTLAPEFEKRFRANKAAWANFEKMPPSYRRPAIWWVMGAKQDATRERRLATSDRRLRREGRK